MLTFISNAFTVKDVHPTLDFIGHFTYLPPPPHNLPRQLHLNIQNQLLSHNESPIFLALHPSPLSTSTGGKLPLTIYESVYEEEGDTPETKTLKMKFTELDYTIETGEAEMIGVDHVAKGVGNAGDETGGSAKPDVQQQQQKDDAPSASQQAAAASQSLKEDSKGKGKGKAVSKEEKESAAAAEAAKLDKEVTFESITLPAQTQECTLFSLL